MLSMQDEQSGQPQRQSRWGGYGAPKPAPMNPPQQQAQPQQMQQPQVQPPPQQVSAYQPAVQPQPQMQPQGGAMQPQRPRSFAQY